MSVASVPIWVAFGAGILSFVSPCTLPLFPSYLGYISGISFQTISSNPEMITKQVRVRAFTHALAFSAGLSVLFVLMGWGATAFGRVLTEYKDAIRIAGGVFIVVMGLFMAGVFKWGWLLRERRFHLPATKSMGYIGSFFVGVVFAAGWTPCIGPILASVLMMIMVNPGAGLWLMVAYALGFALPFMVLAVTLVSIRPMLRYTETISRVGGWLLVIMGLLLLTDKMTILTIWLQRATGYRGV